MSAFFANVQVRTDNRAAVLAAVDALLDEAGYAVEDESFGGDRSVYVGPAADGWIGVYDSAADGISVGPLAWLAQGLSARLGGVTLAWMVHDSALLLYLLFRDGEVADRYVSRPDYFQGAAGDQRQKPAGPLGGDGEILLAAAGVPGDADALTYWLTRPEPFAQATLLRLAAALGQRHADLGHAEIEADQLAVSPLERSEDFVRRDYIRRTATDAD
jgi:hypothetical protein